MRICVVGLGHVGLSNAVLLARHNDVVAVDSDPDRVASIVRRESPLGDRELASFLASENLRLSALAASGAAIASAFTLNWATTHQPAVAAQEAPTPAVPVAEVVVRSLASTARFTGHLEASQVVDNRMDELGLDLPCQCASGCCRAGYLRRLLLVGATSLTRHAPTTDSRTGAWIRSLLERKPTRLVTMAIANKTARSAWSLLVKGESYRAAAAV